MPCLLTNWVNFGLKELHMLVRSMIMSFVKIHSVEALLYWTTNAKFCPIFYLYRPIWIKFSTRDTHENVPSCCEFRESWYSDTILYRQRNWINTRSFDIYCPMWVKFGISDRLAVLLSLCEFRESGEGKALPCLRGQWHYIHTCNVKLYELTN